MSRYKKPVKIGCGPGFRKFGQPDGYLASWVSTESKTWCEENGGITEVLCQFGETLNLQQFAA